MSVSAIQKSVVTMARKARQASLSLAQLPAARKNAALKAMAAALLKERDFLIRENRKDVAAAESAGLSRALIDRLVLNDKRVQAMAEGLVEASRLADPVGEVLSEKRRPNGLLIKKVRVPIGVIGIIYESRPNVTSDCIGLCLKSGNAAVLKGGKESFYSNQAILKVLKRALKTSGVDADAIQMIASTDREAVKILLRQVDDVDLIIPRGGEALIRFVTENSLIPVVKHYKGVCHTYVSESADLKMAEDICVNAKVQRPGVCNAMETLLVHEKIAAKFLPALGQALISRGVELRGDARTRRILKDIKAATDKDWSEEYLDLILSIKVVASTQEAIEHINRYGTKHSDAIVTKNQKEAENFLNAVDSSSVYVNASTRFTDGYEFGLGAEIGISTDKIHARGPMGLEELTTYKYKVYGKGQIRT